MNAKWFQILISVADTPRHGTAIMEDVLSRTGGEMKLWPGALYGSLADLEAAGLIEETDPPPGAPTEGGTRRFYHMTAKGSAALREEAARLEALVRTAWAKVRAAEGRS